jgi:hypothetical protein
MFALFLVMGVEIENRKQQRTMNRRLDPQLSCLSSE